MTHEFIIDATDEVIGDDFDARAWFGPRLREEIVRCSDCVRWEMYRNRCQGWCCEWSTITESCEYCSRGERK